MVRNRRRQLGEGQFGCLVGLVILLLAGLVAYKMIPVKVKSAEIRDTMIDEARSAGSRNDKVIKEAILFKAKQLELPLTEDNINITRPAGSIRVEMNYTVPVAFPGYTYNWKFHHVAENPIF